MRIRRNALRLLTLWVGAALLLTGCAEVLDPSESALGSDEEWAAEYGAVGPFDPSVPAGKEDIANSGPRIAWESTDAVWTIEHQWTDVTAEAGIAWSANSGLTWEQKYSAWVNSLQTRSRTPSGTTFQITTPYGVTLPAPVLECAEVAIFLRATFASWYGLPFYLKAYSNGGNIYLGHFGFRNADGSRFSGTPHFRSAYHDYTGEWNGSGAFPSDSALRARGLYGGGDEHPFLPDVNGEPARAGAYFDALFLNKRVGHFMLLAMSWFGSMHLASESNMFHIQPEATRPGDVLLERWQRSGIGHTVPVMHVDRPMDGRMVISVATGSMPRRQPVWEEGANAAWYFTTDYAGGEGTNPDGDRYAALGGGIRRWRTPVRSGSRYMGTVLDSERDVYISPSDVDTIAARPARFQEILQEVTPEARRDAALTRIQTARDHLADHPSSCAARQRREEGFEALYEVMRDHFGWSQGQVDAQYRTVADYVFGELVYNQSKTCCWNSTDRNMYEIIMQRAQSQIAAAEARGECMAPDIFMARDAGANGDGYQVYAAYADSLGRGDQWVPWSADESCPQRNVSNDTPTAADHTGFCALPSNPPDPPDPTSCADGNDQTSTATTLSAGGSQSASICSGEDKDFYRFQLSEQQTVSVRITFSHSRGDLDMSLLDASGNRVAVSQSTSNEEQITRALQAGTYYAEVYGYNGAEGDYQISLTSQSNDDPACGDAGSSFDSAVAITGSRDGLRICPGESDYWAYTAPSAGNVRFTIHFQHSQGDLDMAVHRSASDQLGISQGTSDTEQVDVSLQAGERVVVRVYGYAGATGAYRLEVAR